MRIAHLCLSCFYIDGFNYQENSLPRQNRLDGHDVLIIASTETFGKDRKLCYALASRYTNEDGIPVIRLAYRRIVPFAVARKLRMHPGVYQLLEEFCPDVIIFHGLCGWELLSAAAYAKRYPEVVLYADSHEDANNSGRTFISRNILHRGYYRFIIHRALPQVRKILCVSLETLEFVASVYRVPSSQLEFYPLGGQVFSDEEYQERRQRIRRGLALSDGQIVLIQAGKMGKNKKIVETLHAFRAVSPRNLQLLIIGSFDDEIRCEVESLLPTISNARYLGWQDAPTLLEHLCAADVYLQPGSQSAIMQNALCARCPVILEDVPSHNPFVDGNGWVVNARQPLTAVLDAIYKNPAQLGRMSRRSLAIAQDLLDYKKLAARIYR
jgi:glycosyltransferase involved in cell wall biosynthesis